MIQKSTKEAMNKTEVKDVVKNSLNSIYVPGIFKDRGSTIVKGIGVLSFEFDIRGRSHLLKKISVAASAILKPEGGVISGSLSGEWNLAEEIARIFNCDAKMVEVSTHE